MIPSTKIYIKYKMIQKDLKKNIKSEDWLYRLSSCTQIKTTDTSFWLALTSFLQW